MYMFQQFLLQLKFYVSSVLTRETIKQVCKSEHQSILGGFNAFLLPHKKKENLPKEGGGEVLPDPLYGFGENP